MYSVSRCRASCGKKWHRKLYHLARILAETPPLMARAILLWAAWCSAHAQKPAGDAREVRDDAQPLEGECERWAAEGECEDNPGHASASRFSVFFFCFFLLSRLNKAAAVCFAALYFFAKIGQKNAGLRASRIHTFNKGTCWRRARQRVLTCRASPRGARGRRTLPGGALDWTTGRSRSLGSRRRRSGGMPR